MKYLALMALFLVFIPQAQSQNEPKEDTQKKHSYWKLNSIVVGAGGFFPFPGEVQTDDQGKMNSLQFHPLLSVAATTSVYKKLDADLTLATTFPKSARDGDNISVLNYFFHLMLNYHPFKRWQFNYGLGWNFTLISGQGGYQALSNGTSTEEFPLPNGSSISSNFVNIVGIKYFFTPSLNLNTQAHIYNLTDSDKRSLAYALTIQKSFSFNNNNNKEQR